MVQIDRSPNDISLGAAIDSLNNLEFMCTAPADVLGATIMDAARSLASASAGKLNELAGILDNYSSLDLVEQGIDARQTEEDREEQLHVY